MDIIKVILTALLSVTALFVIAKVMGHRQVAELDFFDYITGITIGSIAAELATELESPWKPLIAMLIYGAVSIGLNLITNRLPGMRKYINGSPIILMNNSKMYKKNFKKAKLDLDEFLMMCRELGYFNLNDVQTAIFECNGKLTVLPFKASRPATPSDLNLNPVPDSVNFEVIMDGRVINENLKRMGLDSQWLQTQLKAQGYHQAEEIFLGVCDNNHQLSLFAFK